MQSFSASNSGRTSSIALTTSLDDLFADALNSSARTALNVHVNDSAVL